MTACTTKRSAPGARRELRGLRHRGRPSLARGDSKRRPLRPMTYRACTHPKALAATLAPSASSMPRWRPLPTKTPGQLTAPLELAQDGGARVSSRGYVARIGTALGLTFVSATDGVGRGRGQRSQPLALFHRVHGQRGKDMGRPGARRGSRDQECRRIAHQPRRCPGGIRVTQCARRPTGGPSRGSGPPADHPSEEE